MKTWTVSSQDEKTIQGRKLCEEIRYIKLQENFNNHAWNFEAFGSNFVMKNFSKLSPYRKKLMA